MEKFAFNRFSKQLISLITFQTFNFAMNLILFIFLLFTIQNLSKIKIKKKLIFLILSKKY